MAKLHVLTSAGNNLYSAIAHVAVPEGNNSVGVSWSTALKNSGMNTTSLPIGEGPGQITQAEATQISNGELFEFSFIWGDNPNWTNQQRIDDLSLRLEQAEADALAKASQQLKYFGYTIV